MFWACLNGSGNDMHADNSTGKWVYWDSGYGQRWTTYIFTYFKSLTLSFLNLWQLFYLLCLPSRTPLATFHKKLLLTFINLGIVLSDSYVLTWFIPTTFYKIVTNLLQNFTDKEPEVQKQKRNLGQSYKTNKLWG